MIIKKFILSRPRPLIFTIHKDEAKKQRYTDRYKKNEFKYWNKSGIDTASFWSRFLLWHLKNNYCKLSGY